MRLNCLVYFNILTWTGWDSQLLCIFTYFANPDIVFLRYDFEEPTNVQTLQHTSYDWTVRDGSMAYGSQIGLVCILLCTTALESVSRHHNRERWCVSERVLMHSCQKKEKRKTRFDVVCLRPRAPYMRRQYTYIRWHTLSPFPLYIFIYVRWTIKLLAHFGFLLLVIY